MKLRVCVPTSVPGTVAHAVHTVPLNFVYRIELARSVVAPLITNSQTLVPSVAPNRPPLTGLVEPPIFIDCPVTNDGGAGDRAVQLFPAAEYVAPIIAAPVPVVLFLRNA